MEKKNAPFHFSAPEVTNKYGPSGQKLQPVPRGTRRCFICSSPHHLANTCPQRATHGIFSRGYTGEGASQNPVARPRVNACAQSHGKPGRMTQEPIGVTDRTDPESGNNALQPVQKTTEQSESIVNHMKVDEPLKTSQDGENEFSQLGKISLDRRYRMTSMSLTSLGVISLDIKWMMRNHMIHYWQMAGHN